MDARRVDVASTDRLRAIVTQYGWLGVARRRTPITISRAHRRRRLGCSVRHVLRGQTEGVVIFELREHALGALALRRAAADLLQH
jgi:hypothetical protein